MIFHRHTIRAVFLLASASALLLAGGAQAARQAATAPMPQLVHKDGKFAFMVDGAPFLMLAGQANNSSNYPAALPKVWPAMADMHANTLVMPVAWEQIEPTEGHFDFSFVDTLIAQARQHGVRLDILWFGTWKNTGPSYTPQWVQRDNKRFPRMINKDGSTSYCLSPHAQTTREADKKAYVELLKHIKAVDPQHTVILLQIENESGVYGSDRDYSPKAEALFNGPVPAALIQKMGARAIRVSTKLKSKCSRPSASSIGGPISTSCTTS
jgi:beta-galactosidase GanA